MDDSAAKVSNRNQAQINGSANHCLQILRKRAHNAHDFVKTHDNKLPIVKKVKYTAPEDRSRGDHPHLLFALRKETPCWHQLSRNVKVGRVNTTEVPSGDESVQSGDVAGKSRYHVENDIKHGPHNDSKRVISKINRPSSSA